MEDEAKFWFLAGPALVLEYGAIAYVVWTRLKGRPAVELSDDAKERRRAAKRVNEHLKLHSTFSNNLGIAIIVGFMIQPFTGAQAKPISVTGIVYAGLLALGLHAWGHRTLRWWVSED